MYGLWVIGLNDNEFNPISNDNKDMKFCPVTRNFFLFTSNFSLSQEISSLWQEISTNYRKFLLVTWNLLLWKEIPVARSFLHKISFWGSIILLFAGNLCNITPFWYKIVINVVIPQNCDKNLWFVIKTLPESSRLRGKIVTISPAKIQPRLG